MQAQRNGRRVSGHIYQVKRAKGPVWYWKVRLPHGREERRAIGPVWTEKGGRPADGYFTRKTAQAALDARLTDLRRGVGIAHPTGATFRDAAAEWFTIGTTERGWKPSTTRDYRSALDKHLLPHFGPMAVESITTTTIASWRSQRMADTEDALPLRTAVKLLAMLHGILERARKTYKLPSNAADEVERLRVKYTPEDYDFYSPEEVWALVRACDEQDGMIVLTAAFAGMRMGELLAVRVRDVDFEAEAIRVMGSYDHRSGVGTTKGGRGRTVPMVPDLASALARLLQREHFTGRDDLVFPGETGQHLDGSALRRRYRDAQTKAKLRKLRFHDLRHTFGSLAINSGSTREVQEWLGHADARTTARYVHFKRRSDEAKRLAKSFEVETPEQAVEAEAARVRDED